MAWDSPRHGADPLARAWGRQFIGVDELDFYKPVNLSTTRDQDEVKMGKLLSPIDEEGHGMSYHNHNNAPLAIHLTVRFNDPAVKSTHSNSYYSSRSFRTSDRIRRGLIRRIDHDSEELITRKDSHALNNIQCLRKGPKQWRFELTFKIHVKGHSGPWAERIYISYQKQPLSRTSAEQVLHSAHSIVGLFLQRHDKDFYWKDGPSENYFPDSPETFRPGPEVVPNLACVPRTLFVESSQDWEFVPGYTLRLVIKSNHAAQAQSNITRTVRVDSTQISPFNLGLGEDLLWQAYRCVQDVLDAKKDTFDELHADCDDDSGGHCQHHEKNALSLALDVVNNLGPTYDHLQRSIQSDLCLFGDADCNEFADTVRNQFKMLRGKVDQKIEKFHDFDFRIAELVGDGWRETDCARFTVNGHHTLTRRNIEALLERIRTGVGDVLREYGVLVRMVAYKRGHLVLDKALVARDRHSGPSDPPPVLIHRLKERIQKDIDIICQDTCSLDDIPEAAALFTPIRPKMASPRPLTGRSPQTPPGSPASFRTRPPTPPGVPARQSSVRSFPLVPIRYRDSTDGASVSSRSPRPPVVGEEGFPGLKPAAEVYPSSRTVDYDYDVESNSTHSSMPTLAESDTPSPEHSMLITPSGARSFLPVPGGLPFEDSGFRRFSTDGASASSRTSYSEGHQWVECKEDKKPSVPVQTPRTCEEGEMPGSAHVSGTNRIVYPLPSTDEAVRPGPECESCGHDLPTEGWLLYCSEPDAQVSETPKGSHSSTTAAKVEEEAFIGEAALLKHDGDAALVSDSGPAETSENAGGTASDTRDTTGDEARLETIETCTPTGYSVGSESGQRPVGVSERSEHQDHVTAGCEETQWSVIDVDENLHHDPEEKPASDPSMNPTVIVEASETEQEDHVDSQALVSPVPTRESTNSAPTEQSSESIPSEKTEVADTTTSAPTEPRHSKHLLPEPTPPNHNSWSSSSEWEDWISEARHSFDSVDTIRASLHSSIQEDVVNHRPDSPKRLRTPTAGLLGLSESRWADFGIRNALTGTHAFDACRPSTAPLLVESPGPAKTRREELELRDEGTPPAKPHKTRGHHHIRHKKSIGSILFMGGARLNKKQSGELKKPKANKKPTAAVEPEEPVEDVGRFPRAMMLVAGLAFASSVVSRNSS